MLAKRMHQNRDEGMSGDVYERDLADYRGLINASRLSYAAIARKAEPPLHPTTVANIADGTTAKPQDYTIRSILKVLGYDRPIVPTGIAVAAAVKPKPYWPKDMRKRREERRQKRKRVKTGKSRGRRSHRNPSVKN